MVITDKNKCVHCGGCTAVCPKSALTLTQNGIICDAKKCNNCKICVNFCPMGALKIKIELD